MLLLKDLLDALASLLFLAGILNKVDSDGVLQVNIKAVAGGHDVGIVDELDEGLDARAAINLLGAHRLGDLQGVALDAADEGTAKLLVDRFLVLFER